MAEKYEVFVFVLSDFLYATRIKLRAYKLIILLGDTHPFDFTWYEIAS